MEYCTYMTTYLGDKMPKFYIGSTSVKKILTGYHGSVSSKKFKNIWKNELRTRPELFTTEIIGSYSTRKAALDAELSLQITLDVVKNRHFINEALACPNGFFGRSVSGEDHPRFNSSHSDETKLRLSENWHLNRTTDQLEWYAAHMSEIGKKYGKINGSLPCPEFLKQKLRDLKTGVPLTSAHRTSIGVGVKLALSKPEVKAKLGSGTRGKKVPQSILEKRCRKCTIDGIKIYDSVKELRLTLGSGKSGLRHPDLKYIS